MAFLSAIALNRAGCLQFPEEGTLLKEEKCNMKYVVLSSLIFDGLTSCALVVIGILGMYGIISMPSGAYYSLIAVGTFWILGETAAISILSMIRDSKSDSDNKNKKT